MCLNFKARRKNGEMVCLDCGQFSSAQYCFLCLEIRKPTNIPYGYIHNDNPLVSSIEYNFPVEGSFTKRVTYIDNSVKGSTPWTYISAVNGSGALDYSSAVNGSGFFADDISNWEVGDFEWFKGSDIISIPSKSNKECTCLMSDLMINGCTCGGS